jgi:hypothetical protein
MVLAKTMTSLLNTNPDLAKEWHPNKNASLTPENVTPNSNKKVWWRCSKDHEWEARVYKRNIGRGCPYCAGKKVCRDNCLETVYPEVAQEWHPTKNRRLTPRDVTPGSNRKVWWTCNKGHEWETSVVHRSKGSGCPFCSGARVCDDNCLQTVNPLLSEEWHPTKNGDLTPRGVTPGSDTRVWWICGKGHEWEAKVNNRSNGYGCPYCSGRLATEDNNLEIVNPALAKASSPKRDYSFSKNTAESLAPLF